MPHSLASIPRTWAGDIGIVASDLDPSFALPLTSISQGGIVPDKIGLPFTNKTGGTLTAGTLVYISGWDATSGRPTVTKATAANLAGGAEWIVLADTLNNGLGTVGQHFTLTAQNTNAATVGDAVYLSTAGGFVLTNPPGGVVQYQIVGTVTVKSATVGVIELRILGQPNPVLLEQLEMAFGTIATTATTESNPIPMDRAGTIIGFRLQFLSALAINGTNYVTFSANNRTQSKLLTAAVAANTTNTGGQAIVQYTGYPLTVTATAADLVVAAGDVITVSAVVTGTLGATLQGSLRLIHAPL